MVRTLKADVERLFERVKVLCRDAGIVVRLEGAYGRQFVFDVTNAERLSPICTKRELYEWMAAFIKGYDVCYRRFKGN